jgi:MFS family permease
MSPPRRRLIAALFPGSATADARRLVWAKGLRAVADGYVSILLPAYLLLLGYNSLQVGALTTATLLGSALLTLLSGFAVSRLGHRRALLVASVLMVVTGLAFAELTEFWPLLIVAFAGTLNPSSGDVSIFVPLEQSLLSRSVADADRTSLYARYSLIGALMGALGTLLAGLPDLMTKWPGIALLPAMQAMFLLYAGIGGLAGLIYRKLPPANEGGQEVIHAPLGQSRGLVYRLAALFSLDSFGSGFFVQSMLALWLLRSFQLPVIATASIFFWASMLTALSYLAAPMIARRIGLVNTMVFTHLPSSLCLIVIPLIDDIRAVIALLLLRSLLSQMDVPTRTSYVMAVVTPAERPAAASLTSVSRGLAGGISPVIAGYLIASSGFGWPLLIGGGLKVIYDVTLLLMFRHIKPPEEQRAVDAGRNLL